MYVFKANKVWRFKRSHLFAPPFWVGVAVAVISTSGARADELWTSKSLDQRAEMVLIAQANPSTQRQPQRTAQPTTNTPPGAGTSASPPRSAQGAAKVSKLALTMVQLGALRCVERADQLSKFLSPSGTEVAIVDNISAGAISEVITATLLVPSNEFRYSTAEITLTPTINGCSAHYAVTYYVPEKCPEAEKRLYRDLIFNPLEDLPFRLTMIGAGARVLSHQIAAGCLITKHEFIRS